MRMIQCLKTKLTIAISFHAYDNLRLKIKNSIAAIKDGDTFIDGLLLGKGKRAGKFVLEL